MNFPYLFYYVGFRPLYSASSCDLKLELHKRAWCVRSICIHSLTHGVVAFLRSR